jgi:hypothetical protein
MKLLEKLGEGGGVKFLDISLTWSMLYTCKYIIRKGIFSKLGHLLL